MSSADNPYRSWGMIADQAETGERTRFIQQTYLHLGGAIAAYAALEAVLFHTPGVENVLGMVLGARYGWMIVLGAFMGVSWLANSWAQSATSPAMQYAGLSLYVVGQASITFPLLYFANMQSAQIVPMAGVLTGVVFGGLTLVVLLTKADFSFLRMALMLGGLLAMGVVVCSAIFGFSPGIWFSVAMIALLGGYILYDTSNVLHHYRIGQHVAAALALFSSVATLFYYIVRLLMALNRR